VGPKSADAFKLNGQKIKKEGSLLIGSQGNHLPALFRLQMLMNVLKVGGFP
jgi:hypothetical protein